MSREVSTPKPSESVGDRSPVRPVMLPVAGGVAGKQTGGVSLSSAAVGFAHDFSRVPAHAAPHRGATDLPISRPGDSYEQEADRAAEAVLGMSAAPQHDAELNRTTSTAPPQAQAQTDASAAHESAPPHAGSHALPGAGQPLPDHVRDFFEPRFGSDFSRVRVHADAHAAASAQRLGARAYTLGRDIVFDAGEYRPETSAGRNLLAHELAHVVQQGGSSAAGGSVALQIRRRLRATPVARPTIQRQVKTWGGEWHADNHKTINDGAGNPIGVGLTLRFTPGDVVDASGIGIVQMATSKDLGKTLFVNPTVQNRSIAAGKTGEGAHIDQAEYNRNPLYAVEKAPAKDRFITDTGANAGFGQHGYHHVDKAGTLHKLDAKLIDAAKLPGHGANASQIFETTALAISGVQTGTYYGSVQWGWRTDAANTFKKLPLTKVRDDVPSSTFRTAAGIFGRTKTSLGEDPLRLQVSFTRFTNADDVLLVSDPADAAGSTIDKLAKNVRLQVINKGVWEAFNRGPAADHWWKVTISDGALAGRVGWVRANQLSDKRV